MDTAARHMIDGVIAALQAGMPAALTSIDAEVPAPANTSYLRWGRPSWPHLPAVEVSLTMIDGVDVDPSRRHAYAAVEVMCVTHAQRPGLGHEGLMDLLDTYAQAIVTVAAEHPGGMVGVGSHLTGFRMEHRADPWFRDTNDAPSRASLVVLRFSTDVDLQGV